MRVKYITAYDVKELEQLVNKALQDGWNLKGSASINRFPDNAMLYIQTLFMRDANYF